MRIVHVTEALGGGILTVLSQLAQAQIKDGFEVYLVYSVRPGVTPADEIIVEIFPPPIKLIEIPMVTSISPFKDITSMLRLIKIFFCIKPNIIHLHSSKAGVLGRAAIFFNRPDHCQCFYSPHGLSILRTDINYIKRKIYLFAEKLCSFAVNNVLVACSPSEAHVARTIIGHKKVVCVENGVNFKNFPVGLPDYKNSKGILTMGRVTYQKAPWKFNELAFRMRECKHEFIWIGSGELEGLFQDEHRKYVKLLSWMERDCALQKLSQSSVFVMTSLWEGMPIALIEAQACGIPAVVMDCVGSRDVVQHGLTGYICKNLDEMEFQVGRLLSSTLLRTEIGENARLFALNHFNINKMHRKMLNLYSNYPE